MQMVEPPSWQSYEEVARYLIEKMSKEFGLERVEVKQTLDGQSGATWEIDAKGVKADGDAIVVIECRCYTTSKLKQEQIGALAYRIGDVGAAGGIVVTPIGVQEGGRLIAQNSDIEIVRLDADSTKTDYMMEFLDQVRIGRSFVVDVPPTIMMEGKLTDPATPLRPAPTG